MYSPSAFCKLLFAENKRLIRPVQTSLHTSKEVVLTQGKGENTCLPQTELSTSQVFFQFTVSRFGKLIPFLLPPVEFTILCCVLCEVQSERGVDEELSVVYGIALWFVPYSISLLDNCFLTGGKVFPGKAVFLMIIPLLPLGVFWELSACSSLLLAAKM